MKENAENNPLQLTSLNHISVLCRSVEESIYFYQKVLGFVPIRRPGSFDFDGAWLYGYGVGVHLLQSEDPENMPKKTKINPKDNHISFQCENMGAVEKKLKEMGIKYRRATVEEGGIRIDQLFFHDPDYFMIEICNCDSLPASPSSSSSAAETKSFPSSWSSVSSLPNDAVPLPFPSLSAAASITHLRSFAAISRGLFKLVFVGSDPRGREPSFDGATNWDCCSFSLFSRVTGDRIGSMDGFSRALAGMGWTLFKTAKNPSPGGRNQIYLFRKVDSRRVRVVRIDGDGGPVAGECRVRELRLPTLDFRNAPLRILQYIVLMTDDVFYLA